MIIGIGGKKGAGKNSAAKLLTENYGFKEYSLAQPLKQLAATVFDMSYDSFDNPELKDLLFERPVTVDSTDVYEIVRQCMLLLNLDGFKKSEETVTKHMMKRIVKKNNTTLQMPQMQGNQQTMPVQFQKSVEYKTFESPRKLIQFIGTELIRDCISPYFWCRVLDNKIKDQENVVITDIRFFEEREYILYKKGLLILIERPSETEATDKHSSETSLGSRDEYHYTIQNDSDLSALTHRLDALYTYESLLKAGKVYKTNLKEEDGR
jgi:hypothetical protein